MAPSEQTESMGQDIFISGSPKKCQDTCRHVHFIRAKQFGVGEPVHCCHAFI